MTTKDQGINKKHKQKAAENLKDLTDKNKLLDKMCRATIKQFILREILTLNRS